jgi:hypothetical protein
MSDEQKKTIEIPTQLLQEVINYLQTKPYVEVYKLIHAMMESANK